MNLFPTSCLDCFFVYLPVFALFTTKWFDLKVYWIAVCYSSDHRETMLRISQQHSPLYIIDSVIRCVSNRRSEMHNVNGLSKQATGRRSERTKRHKPWSFWQILLNLSVAGFFWWKRLHDWNLLGTPSIFVIFRGDAAPIWMPGVSMLKTLIESIMRLIPDLMPQDLSTIIWGILGPEIFSERNGGNSCGSWDGPQEWSRNIWGKLRFDSSKRRNDRLRTLVWWHH